jgi:hypothetical protein
MVTARMSTSTGRYASLREAAAGWAVEQMCFTDDDECDRWQEGLGVLRPRSSFRGLWHAP